MSLIKKTILYYLLLSLPLLLIAGFISYFLIQNDVRESTDESLWKEKLNAEKIIKSWKEPQTYYLSSDSLSKIIVENTNTKGHFYYDTILFDKSEQENINYRVLYNYSQINNVNYQITIIRSSLESDELTDGLLFTLSLILGFLVISFFFANLIFSKILWKPFYKTIEKLNSYDIKQNTLAEFETSSINEFKKLNEALTTMTNKIYSDYNHLKEFSENASHEMQTPLAVIKAKLELLIQSQNLREQEMQQIQAIDDSVNKLSALNKALVLLTKIENNQFVNLSKISIQKVIDVQLLNFESFIQNKNITIQKDYQNEIIVEMNATLCDILIANLLQNAIKHNIDGGSINIIIEKNKCNIVNTGLVLNAIPVELFERFKKNDSSKDSLGLGLSIVKSIIDRYSFNINYKYEMGVHSVSVLFANDIS